MSHIRGSGCAVRGASAASIMRVQRVQRVQCVQDRQQTRRSRTYSVSPQAFLSSEKGAGEVDREKEVEYVGASVSTTAPPREKTFVTPIFSDGYSSSDSSDVDLAPLPKNVENRADDPSLMNPLQRHKRLSTSWMGVIMELEGVCVEYEKKDVVMEAWKRTAEEVGKATPMQFQLDRAIGMKADQAVQEAFNWTRNPAEARRIAGIKQDILIELLADAAPVGFSSSLQFLKSLSGEAETPCALVSSSPESIVFKVLDSVPELEPMFEVVVSAEDVYRGRPDPEGYLYAAQRLDRPPFRCVVVGDSNASVEAAHEVGMKCVVVAGGRPLYEVGAADLVVRSLDEVSFINLKKLFQEEQSDAIPLSDLEEEEEFY